MKGYTAPKSEDDEQPWFCRASEHPPEEATFDEMWFGLGTLLIRYMHFDELALTTGVKGTKKPEHEQK